MYMRDFASRSRTARIFRYSGDPRGTAFFDTVEHGDDDPPLRRVAFDADIAAAADEIATAEPVDRRLDVRGIVPLETSMSPVTSTSVTLGLRLRL